MSIDSETLRVGRDRITRVFRYLEALNQHRNPAKRQIREQLWSLWFKDLPQHPTIQRGNHTLASKAPDSTLESDASDVEVPVDDFVLRVRRPKLTQPLRPPEIIAPWLESGWENPDRDVRVSESRNEIDADGESLIVRFDDDPERIQAFEIWRDKREQWARNERPARKAMQVFEELYEVYGRIEREAERVELVLGDGILNWYRPEGGVHHPILLQRLQLEFNPQIPQFTLVETDHAVELYSALFQSMDDVDGKAIAQCRNELEQGDFHPLADGATSGFLKRLIVQLSSRGEFITDGSPQGEMDYPRIGRDPVIFLRARTLGFAVAIEAVLQNLEEQEQLPDSLLNVVGVEAQLQEDITEAPAIEPWEEPEEILFSKPANPEQFRIANQLETHSGVLVQGPPGTGKSHTIANLIGHLLAHGKSVLVTSHATKALRVLRGHVVEQLQPLCLSVLESDIESRSQLESSVTAIVERLITSDDRRLSEQGNVLSTQRNQLIKKLQDTRQELAEARWSEYQDIVLAGQGFSPSEAARRVGKGEQSDSWIPGPVKPGIPLPLSHGELIDLYRSNIILKTADEVELTQSLPDPIELLPPEEFSKLADTRRKLDSRDLQFRSDLWNSPNTENGAEELRALLGELPRAMELINSSNTLKLTTLSAGRKGGANRDIWDTLLAMINGVINDAASAQETLLRNAPSLSDSIPFAEQLRTADEIIDYLNAGRKLGSVTLLVHLSWKRFIREAKVVTGQPQHVEQFQALRSMIGLKMARNELAGRWDRQVAVLGAPKSETFGEEIENDCSQISDDILRCLRWDDDVLEPLKAKLKALSFKWEIFIQEQPPQLGPHGDLLRLRKAVLEQLPKVLASRSDLIDRNRLDAKIEALTQRVALASDGRAPTKVSNDLTEAIRALDAEAFSNAFQRLVELRNLLTTYKSRHELLARLEVAAPAWARSIRDRIDSHGGQDLPGDVTAAWLWRQLTEELERREATSLEDLQQKVLQ